MHKDYYTLKIKLAKNGLKSGLNEITVIDNISREHTTKFMVTD